MNEQNELWKVERITDTTILSTGVGSVQAKRVDFKVIDGTRSFITVNVDEFTPERVAELINEAAAKIIAVAALVGPVVP